MYYYEISQLFDLSFSLKFKSFYFLRYQAVKRSLKKINDCQELFENDEISMIKRKMNLENKII